MPWSSYRTDRGKVLIHSEMLIIYNFDLSPYTESRFLTLMMSSDLIHSCCMQGSLHDGRPTGHINNSFITTQYGDVAAYISDPGDAVRTDCGLLLLSDFFGYDAINTRLLADRFAQKG